MFADLSLGHGRDPLSLIAATTSLPSAPFVFCMQALHECHDLYGPPSTGMLKYLEGKTNRKKQCALKERSFKVAMIWTRRRRKEEEKLQESRVPCEEEETAAAPD